MKYVVSIGYRDFGFDNSMQAIAFADMAKMHYISEKEDDSINVQIELVNDEPAKAENKED